MQLFVVYVGGSHEGANIELHDMRFVVGEKIEDTYDQLKAGWWGTPRSLHLDAWGALQYVDGYKIQIKQTPPENPNQRLFFLNLGGYHPEEFTELHKNMFVVAENSAEAKARAKRTIQQWHIPHKDNLYEVENLINLNQYFASQEYYIHLTPTEQVAPFEFICDYVAIGQDLRR